VSRIQLALNVSNLEESINFYSAFFKTGPAKVRPGYANFALDEPPLKLVLIENASAPGSINHLGVEVFSSGEVADAIEYLTGAGFATDIEEHTTCCYAVQDKVWVEGPDTARWEVYTVLGDAEESTEISGDGSCCASRDEELGHEAITTPACC
jgi:Glyoxalase/Bleomycin resistance protein/Dioxygenase superfamily